MSKLSSLGGCSLLGPAASSCVWWSIDLQFFFKQIVSSLAACKVLSQASLYQGARPAIHIINKFVPGSSFAGGR